MERIDAIDFCKFFPSIEGCLSAAHMFGMQSSNYGSLTAAVLATIIIALTVFLVKESRIPASRFCGVFYLETITQKTEYRPYNGLRTFRTLIIFTDGQTVEGTCEKTGEINKNASIEYVGSERCRGVISGRIEKNYTRGSVLYLQIIESGKIRDSTIYIKIPITFFESRGELVGGFFTTAADSSGGLLWQRKPFKEHPSKPSPCRYPPWWYW